MVAKNEGRLVSTPSKRQLAALQGLIDALYWHAKNTGVYGSRARRALVAYGIYVCDRCYASANLDEFERCTNDRINHERDNPPVRWTCMKCAPDLKLASSGLGWDIVDVVGSSPEDYGK